MKEDVPPVRLGKSSTLVKAKTSAPLPLPTTSCAALTQRALGALSPHREGTRSRRCGRRLTGGTHRGLLTSGTRMNLGTVWAAPADWGPVPPRPRSLFMGFCWGPGVLMGTPTGDTSRKQHSFCAGWRSKVPWACLYQLQIRSQTSKLVSGVRTYPPAS
jgi:hypothetical protein